MDNELTSEDLRSIDYFLSEKHDITRWSSWDERRSIIETAMPDLKGYLDTLDEIKRVKAAIYTHIGMMVDKKLEQIESGRS